MIMMITTTITTMTEQQLRENRGARWDTIKYWPDRRERENGVPTAITGCPPWPSSILLRTVPRRTGADRETSVLIYTFEHIHTHKITSR